jgi:hypothetical protein
MDSRFPAWLRTVVRKLDFLGIPNLGSVMCGLCVMGFLVSWLNPGALMHFYFVPQLVLQGEWWRILGFFLQAGVTSPITLLFMVLYIYFVMNALESAWGPGPVTVFVLLSYLTSLAGSLIIGTTFNTSLYVIENIGLAFGTLFPDFELLIYFILPIKAKWLALFTGMLILMQFIAGTMEDRLFILFALSPYLLFFSPMLFQMIKTKIQVTRNRRRFKDDMWR